MDATIQGLEEYTKKSKERIITTASNGNKNWNNLRINRKMRIKKSKKTKNWKKNDYGYF